MPSEIEEIGDRCMSSEKFLSLPDLFELSHPSLSNSGSLMGLLCPIISILACVMDNIWHQFPMSNAITTQFVSHDLPGLALVTP